MPQVARMGEHTHSNVDMHGGRGNLRRVFRFPIDNLRSLIKWRRVEEAATWSTFEGDLLERHFSFDNLIEHFEPT